MLATADEQGQPLRALHTDLVRCVAMDVVPDGAFHDLGRLGDELT